MLKVNKKPKTALAPRRPIKTLLVLIALLVGLTSLLVWGLTTDQECLRLPSNDNKCISLEQADTEAKQMMGLSGRRGMPMHHGMLFVFNESGEHCFWMKGMNFNLDIIWINENKEVVALQPNVSPSTYPETFCPQATAKYVIELNANAIEKYDIAVGQTLNF